MRMLLVIAFFLSAAFAALAQDITFITPSGVLTNPATTPPEPYLALTEDGAGFNTTEPCADWDISKGPCAVEIKSDNAGFLLYLNLDNAGTNGTNSRALQINSDSQWDPPIYSVMGDNKAIVQLGHWQSAIGSNWLYRDIPASESQSPLLRLQQANANDDQPALVINQAGSGAIIDATRFKVPAYGGVITDDTLYFSYASPGGSPLCYSVSGTSLPDPRTGKRYIRPCATQSAMAQMGDFASRLGTETWQGVTGLVSGLSSGLWSAVTNGLR